MKKFLIIAAAAATVLASCAKTETVEVSDAKYIGFDSAWIGNPTKAIEEVKTDNIKSFFVYGGYTADDDVFENGREVTPNTNGEWTYSPLVKWEDNQTYNFYAYSGVSVTPAYSYSDGLTFSDVTVNGTDNQTDFIYAETTNVSSGAEGTVRDKVQFTFNHLFSMVQFTIKSGFPEDVVLNISDFELYGLYSKASFNASGTADEWTVASDQLAEGNGINLKEGKAQATEPASTDYVDNCVVMPQTFSDNFVYAKFTLNVPTSTSIATAIADKVITAKIPADEWVKGYRYNYIVTIDGQTLDFITFDAPVVNKWTDENINMVNDPDNSGQFIRE